LSLSEAQTRDYTLYLYSIYYRATDYGDNSRTQPIDLFLQRFPASNLGYFFHKEVEVNEYVQVADDFWELKLSNGHRYYAQGDIDQAWQTFQQILKINPAVPEAICGLARIHYDLDLYQDALNDYCLALEKSPLYFRALFGKAVCLYELRDFQASLTALNTMIDNQLDRSGEACYFRALNFYELGKNKEVEENITLAYSFIPFSLELVLFACRYYYETGQSASFREYLQQGEKIDAASADVLFFKGLFLFQQQERQKALESFFKSLSGYWQRIGHFSAAAEQEQQHSGNDFRFSNQKLRQLKKNRAQTIKEAIRKSKFVKSVYKKATHPLLKSIHALQQQFMTTAKELSQSPEWLTAEE
jgi:tetratricopeptide (TPR) repeat protein